MMEQELDLRPYVSALLRRWRLIISAALIFSALAMGLLLLQSRSVVAVADLLVAPTTPQVSLDERYTERDSLLVTNQVFQRQALINLATSTTLESQVAKELNITPYVPGALLERVTINSDSDLLRIRAAAPTDAEAITLADTWARSYARLVTEVYTNDALGEEQLVEELAEAGARFDAIQVELEQFYADGRIVSIEQQINNVNGVLDGSREASELLYSQYLTRTREVELLIQDAQAIQAQTVTGSTASVADVVASLALRARAVGGEQAPIQLQIGGEGLVSGGDTATELERLIGALEELHARLTSESAQIAQAVATGDSSVVGLSPETTSGLIDELARLRGEQALLESRERLLEQRRDVALEALQLLQRKSNEQQIAQTTPTISVRFVSTTLSPPESMLSRLLMGIVGGFVVGAVLGATLVLVLDFLVPWVRSTSAARPGVTPDRPVKQPTSTD